MRNWFSIQYEMDEVNPQFNNIYFCLMGALALHPFLYLLGTVESYDFYFYTFSIKCNSPYPFEQEGREQNRTNRIRNNHPFLVLKLFYSSYIHKKICMNLSPWSLF